MRNSSIVLLCVVLLGMAQLASPQTSIKIATLSPKGSTAAKILDTWSKRVESITASRVKIQLYYSAVQGNERDMINKMKTGQLDGGLFSSEGLKLISKSLSVFELPYMFKSQKEVDDARIKLADDFNSIMDTAGYVLLGWVDPGWTYILANSPIASRANLVQTKMWSPINDYGVRAFWVKVGVNGTPLGLPDVLPSMQTGLIDACFGTYLTCVSLQWYTKVKYAASSPFTYAIGACILRKSTIAGLTEEDRKQLIQTSEAMAKELSQSIRTDNDRAGKTMEKAGVQHTPFSQAMIEEMTKDAKSTWENQANTIYASELLKKIQSAIAEVQ
jgi:TRAP-type transport system periplasmic protein